ncbi:acyltransferase family protein [Fibrobacter intestinalis]|uniref:Acyltransferase family protein n=1 Tax=Fibrobacter intestinalis TaxID=28122 RepID=A0A1T4M8Q3_9BACT|nr:MULTISPECIES: acyltransferase family protein [Fibrobacter]PBC73583.1 acyltransferase-like protein [Fibrobacter sp. NR9]SJZ63226.1 Acyltransferase family protein [Fibrobacter intestinalis]
MKCNTNALTYSNFSFALCIIALHAKISSYLPEALGFFVERSIFRLAVPFFFFTSVFFFCKKFLDKELSNRQVTFQYIKRLAIPLFFFESINILLINLKLIIKNKFTLAFFLKDSLEHIVFYPYGALWFIQACIVGALILSPFLAKKKIVLSVFAGFILYTWALLCNNYYFLLEGTELQKIVDAYMDFCLSARNGIFVGFPFMALGAFSFYYRTRIRQKFSPFLIASFTFLLYFLYLLEIRAIRHQTSIDDSALYILQLFFIPSFFFFILEKRISLKETTTKLLRNLSVGMYFLHRPLFLMMEFTTAFWGFRNTPLMYFSFAAILGCAICLIDYKRVGNGKSLLR